MAKLKKPGKNIDLDGIEEGDLGASTQAEGERRLLRGFSDCKVKIHLLADQDIKQLSTKRKYKGLFDVGVVSVHSADKISPELTTIFKDKAKVHCETADFVIVMKPEQRVQYRTSVLEKATEANWTVQEEAPYSHHLLFEVQNPEANNLPAEEEDSDGSDL